MQSVPELFCSHEEADTRLLLQCRYAAKSNSSVVIQSPDTDVLVITMSKCHDIGANVFFVTGRGDQRRTIDITAMNKYFGAVKSSAILGLHNFTGCDSVSAFHGIGKKKPVECMLKNSDSKFVGLFCALGQSFDSPEHLLPLIEEFVCALYGKEELKKVNAARAVMFKTGKQL